MLPLAIPTPVGAKVTANEVLAPALSVVGVVSPFRLNPGPLMVFAKIVTLVPPVLVRVTFRLLVGAWTLPKAMLAGSGERLPWVTAVPESGMLKVGALELMVRLPLAAPAAVGAKVTVKEILSPALSVFGRDNPFRLNPTPVMESAEIVTLLRPLFVSVSV
jgi:hypothetical protein